MDSITQIVLGAGVGELILGRKLGNRAMVWGGIAATIPDLDVFSGPFLTAAQSLHAHRGFSHSIFFALLAPLLYSFLLVKLYDNGYYLSKFWKNLVLVFGIFGCVFVGLLPGIVAYFAMTGFLKWLIFIGGIGIGILLINRFWKNYYKNQTSVSEVSFKEWYIFFFWATFTHPILDCFTVYGTQLFAPFSDVRISWDNISVADPAYTLLFGIPLIAAAVYNRTEKMRLVLATLGIVLSTMYMNMTFLNKQQVNHVMTTTLKNKGIEYSRFMNNPTILNNILFSGTAETKDNFYMGQYSLFDQEDIMQMQEIPKNYQLLKDVKADDYDVNTIKWFSNGYYAAMVRSDGRLQINDLRYGAFSGDGRNEDDFLFKFVLDKDANGYYHIDQSSQRSPDTDMKGALSTLLQRMKGI